MKVSPLTLTAAHLAHSQVHALTSLSICTALELAATRLLPLACASGPYGHIFAMLPLFFTDVPCMARFTLGRPGTVLFVPLSDKVFTYAVAAQLALVRGWSSLVAAACGLAAGVLVCTSGLDADGSEREDDAGASWFSITGSLVRLLAAPWRLVAQALASYGMLKGSADADDSTRAQTQAQAQRQQRQGVEPRQAAAGGGGGGGAGPSTAGGALRREADSTLRRRRPTAEGAVGGGNSGGEGEFEENNTAMPEPDAGSLDMLCQMGFAPEEARMALLAGNGDVSVAANILLS
jgi:UBA/TS-N domain